MQHRQLRFGVGFHVVLGDEHSQAAQMTLDARGIEGGPRNRHGGADQWLFVVGEGSTVVESERVELREGTLLLIQRGELTSSENRRQAAADSQPLRPTGLYHGGRRAPRRKAVTRDRCRCESPSTPILADHLSELEP